MEDELRQAKEEAEQASRIKSQFLATVSHEIRTPMHAILGMAEMLRQTPLNNRQSEYVDTFHSAGKHLLKLINDILDYSRLEAGGLQLAKQNFNLDQLLQEIIALLGTQASNKGLQLELDISPQLHPYRRGDPQRLQQILVNLISNAIKFTQQGKIKVQVYEQDKQWLSFSITDSGIGIADKQQKQIFQPFIQLDAGNTREQGGTGLGLSICNHLVEAMGGKIKVESESGQGSRFTFTLPLERMEKHDITSVQNEVKNKQTLTAATILIADDSEINQRVIAAFLQDSNCQLTFTQNGLEAIAHYQQNQPDLVFMDMQMPQLDGGSATIKIRQHEQQNQLKPVPIIALSASAMEEDKQTALAAGCDEFYPKPLSQQQLFTLLEKYL